MEGPAELTSGRPWATIQNHSLDCPQRTPWVHLGCQLSAAEKKGPKPGGAVEQPFAELNFIKLIVARTGATEARFDTSGPRVWASHGAGAANASLRPLSPDPSCERPTPGETFGATPRPLFRHRARVPAAPPLPILAPKHVPACRSLLLPLRADGRRPQPTDGGGSRTVGQRAFLREHQVLRFQVTVDDLPLPRR